MPKPTLEERITKLEQQMVEVERNGVERKKDWRRTVGMFTGDDIVKRMFEEAMKYHEADRRKARRRSTRRQRART